MKFTPILLLGLVVLSNQQFYQQLTNDRLLWLLSHYSPQQPTLNNYNSQPVNNPDIGDGRIAPFLNNWPHSPGIPTYSEDKQPYLNAIENANNVNEDQFPDVEMRGKLGVSRYRPSFLPLLKPQYNPRIVINLASRTNLLNKVKTVTFTFTSSVTFTSVQSCIPSTEFSPGSAGVNCRKRRGVLESSDSKLETNPFAIAASGVQPVEQTALWPQDPSGESGPFANDLTANHGIVSSKDEDTMDELSNVTLKPVGYLRDKRFFFHLVTTATAISYTFLSTTVTKTVNLLSQNAGPIGQLICVPQGYAVCPYIGTLFPR